MSENLIQAVNIVGSIFYGVVRLVPAAFFTKSVCLTVAFWEALAAQALVCILFSVMSISHGSTSMP
jgi:solute:Na+ symporter, SSS family